MATTSTTVNIHDTDPKIWDALARVFAPLKAETTEWVQLECEGVWVNFFKEQHEPEDVPEDEVV